MELGLAMTLILFAGVVRGYSGFGFAIIAALSLSFIVPPLQAVTIAILLDFLSAFPLLKRSKTTINIRLIAPLCIGMLVAVPFSLYFISTISESGLKAFIAMMSLVAGTLIILDLRLTWLHQRHAFWAGAISGFSMTTASSGGPPLVTYLMNLTIKTSEQRATAIVFFLLSSAISLIGFIWIGAFNQESFITGLWLLPAALIGNVLGQKLYLSVPNLSAKTTTAPILIGMALLMLISN